MAEKLMLDLYKLHILTMVVQEGSFSAAADRLYMTQSAISQHIRNLESSLGTSLFNRGRRGVTLTPAGETLYGYTRQILNLLAEAESAVTTVENLDSGHLRIGSTPGVSSYLLPGWIGHFREQYPNIMVAIQTATTPQIIADVLDHTLDLGIIEGELEENGDTRLGHIPLDNIDLYVVVGQQHPWRNQAAIQVADLNQQPFITRQLKSQTRIWLENLLHPHQVTLKIVAEFDNIESIKHAVASGMGIAILPDYAVRAEVERGTLRTLSITDLPLRRTLKLICDNRTPFHPITRAFLMTLAESYPHIREAL